MEFVVDSMLKGLMRWLRFLGFDSTELDTKKNKQLVDEENPNRYFLTASSNHYQNWNGDKKLLIPFDNIPDQLDYLDEKLNIYAQVQFLSRCSICNEEILPVSKQKVSGNIPEKVFNSFGIFYLCPSCNRIYWKGGHVERMIRKLEKMGIEIK